MRKVKIVIALVALVVLFTKLWWLHVLSLLVLIFLSYKKINELKSPIFLVTLLTTTFLPYIFLRSPAALTLSLLIFSRTLALYLAMLVIAENIDLHALHQWLPKILGKRLALAVNLAFNLLPIIRYLLLKNYELFYFKKANVCRQQQNMWGNIIAIKKVLSGYVYAVLRQIIAAAEGCAENMLLLYQASENSPQVYLLTGNPQSGKTTAMAKLVAEFQSYNWPVSGVLAPGVMTNNQRATIFAQNIKTNEKQLLASRVETIDDVAYEFGSFKFSASGLQFARAALLDFYPRGIVVLDEYGPLELKGLGHADEFKQLLKSNVAAIYLVTREGLLSQ
jgi:nucleoside-triphosphatase THEP1